MKKKGVKSSRIDLKEILADLFVVGTFKAFVKSLLHDIAYSCESGMLRNTQYGY